MAFYKKFKKWGWRAIITLVLLVFLIVKINFSEIIHVFSKIDILILILSLPLFFIVYLINALRWNIALKFIGINISLLNALRILLIGTFYGLITPGKAGELARAYYLKEKKSKTISTVIWDKLINIACLVILSAFSIALFFKNTYLIYITVIIIFLLMAFMFLIMNKKVVGWLTKIAGIKEEPKEVYLENMMKFARNKVIILKLFLWSVVFYLVSIGTAIFILISLKPEANLLLVFSLPLIMLFGNAPITISGLGLREGIAAFSFEVVGESASLGFSFSLLWFLIMVVLPGIIGYFLSLSSSNN